LSAVAASGTWSVADRRVEVVFASYIRPRRPQVRVGLFDSSAASRTLPAIPQQRSELLPAPAREDSAVL
jgi:hypothetical protein